MLRLFDVDIAGAGVGADGWSAAIDGAIDVVGIDLPLHGDRLSGVDGAGAGAGVESVAGRGAEGQLDGAGAGVELPVGGGLTAGFDVSGAGAGSESAGESAEVDGA